MIYNIEYGLVATHDMQIVYQHICIMPLMCVYIMMIYKPKPC